MNDKPTSRNPFTAPAAADHERRIRRARRSLRIISPALAALLLLPLAAQASSSDPPGTTSTGEVATATASTGLSNKVYTVFDAVAGDTRTTAGTAEASTSVLTITVDDVRSFYGDYPESYTVKVDGLKGTDTAASVTQGLRISGPNPAADVGEYPIQPYGATVPAGYTVQYVNGSHTIDPVPLQVRVDDLKTRYGSYVPSFQVRYYGLRNGDTAPATVHALRVVTDGGPLYGDQVTPTASTDAGSYDVYPDVFDRNYEIHPVAGKWTVAKAPLSVTVDPVTMTWGDPLPRYHTEVRGLVNGDTTSDLTPITAMGPIRMRPDVGTYQLTLSGGTSPNYETHYGTSGMRVDPRPVTVTVDNKTRVYGSPNPTFTATVTGMPAGVTLPTSFETMPRDLGVGTRTIHFEREDDPNLKVEIRGGTLTTTPAQLTVTPPFRRIASGASLGDLSPTLTGWVYDDTDADLRSKPACRAAVGGAPVSAATKPGVYHDAISCAGGEAPAGYAFAYRTNVLWINPVMTLQATGLPTGLAAQATVDGESVALPRTAVEVQFGATHSYQFEGTVIDNRGRVFITTAAPFSGQVLDNANVTAAYSTMGRLLSDAVNAGQLDESGGGMLADVWFPTERDVVADYQYGALAGLREFAASVRSLSASSISAEVSANLLAHAQVVWEVAGGSGAV